MLFIGLKKLVDFLPQLRCGDVAKVMCPNGFEHLLECKGSNLQDPADACVGVGCDCASFAPLLSPLHHDVAVGSGLVIVRELLVVLDDLGRCAVLHVFFDVFGAFVKRKESFLVHPGVVGRMIADVGAIDHQVGVGVVFVVDDVVVGDERDKMFEKPMCEPRLSLEVFPVSWPLRLEELVELFEDAVVHGKLMML